ncbi:Protein hgh1 [Talaromyces marneffei ATCC 18224]
MSLRTQTHSGVQSRSSTRRGHEGHSNHVDPEEEHPDSSRRHRKTGEKRISRHGKRHRSSWMHFGGRTEPLVLLTTVTKSNQPASYTRHHNPESPRHTTQDTGLSKSSTNSSTRRSQKKTPTSSILSLFFGPVTPQPAKSVKPVKKQNNLHKLFVRRHTSHKSGKTGMFPLHVLFMSSTTVHSVHDRSPATYAAQMLYSGPHPECKAEFCMRCAAKWKTCDCPWFNHDVPEHEQPVEFDEAAVWYTDSDDGDDEDVNGWIRRVVGEPAYRRQEDFAQQYILHQVIRYRNEFHPGIMEAEAQPHPGLEQARQKPAIRLSIYIKMPTELEELVEFLGSPNPQIRQIAAANLTVFSSSQPTLFKKENLQPIKDLKILVRDHPTIAKDALTMLINLSADGQILRFLADDDDFVELLIAKVTNKNEPNADDIAMLLANLAKADSFSRIISLTRKKADDVSTSTNALDQLLDCFVKGADGALNKAANYDYLAYVFADLSKTEEGRKFFTTKQDYDGVIPVTKLLVFTEHTSDIRRRGVAWTIKNVCFDVQSHPMLISEEEDEGANLLPYILLPIMGPEEYPDDESSEMLPDLQLLPPDKRRETDNQIILAHLETLLLLTTTREVRDKMRQVQVYPIIRECHSAVENEEVREACDRLVQVLMRGEEGEVNEAEREAMERAGVHTMLGQPKRITEEEGEGEEEDEQIVDILA